MIDFLKYADYEETNIVEMKRVICITSLDEVNISFRQYEVPSVNETDAKNNNIQFTEIGPHFNLAFRRDKIASTDLFK